MRCALCGFETCQRLGNGDLDCRVPNPEFGKPGQPSYYDPHKSPKPWEIAKKRVTIPGGCPNDTNGDGNCGMPTCPQCHPENMPEGFFVNLSPLRMKYMNAAKTYGVCLGHGKARRNWDAMERWKSACLDAGEPVPTDAEVKTHGQFNGEGAC